MRIPRNESVLKRRFRTFVLMHPLIPYKTISGKLLTSDATRVLICCVYDVDYDFYFGYPVSTNHLDAYLGESKTKHPMKHIEIYSALEYLRDAGLVEYLHGVPDNFEFRATHEGMHYFELRRKNFVFLLVNSILLPIIISIVTTLIALVLSA